MSTLMSILSVMIYSNRTSQCVEKFIPSSLRAHHPFLLFISSMRVHVLSAGFAPSLNISQNKWTLEEGAARSWREGGESSLLGGEAPLGRDRSLVLFLPPGAGAPVSAWGQKSQRHLTNCVSSISSKKDHSKFNWDIVLEAEEVEQRAPSSSGRSDG